MAWHVSSLLARAGRALGLRRRWVGARGVARRFAARGPVRQRGEGAAARAYSRALALLPEDDRFAIAKAVVDLDADGQDAVRRGLASGGGPHATLALAARWATLQPLERAMVVNPTMKTEPGPVAWAGTPARQVDETTCGAASMAMMAAIGDPFVALWLASGRVLGGYVPPEVERLQGWRRLDTVERRWEALQRSIHHATTRRGLGLFAWPKALGTPPWRVDNNTRFADLRFRGMIVDDADQDDLTAVIDHASAALRDGIPVPLYASGDSEMGLDTVIPRHVVLLVRRTEDGFLAYEPTSGALHLITERQLRSGAKKLKALGNWSRVAWVVLPRARRPVATG